MTIAQYRRVRCKDDDLRQVQDAVGFVFQDIMSRQVIDGQIISNVTASAAFSVDHKLNRKPNGYLVISKDTNVNIWDSQASNPIPSSTLELNSSGAATISLWVF